MYCERCFNSGNDVEDREDPFELEMNNKIVIKSLCSDCYRELSEEV